MKLKKMLCGLAAFVTMFSACCVVPVSADVIDIYPSDTPNFLEEYDVYARDNGSGREYYYTYTEEARGTYYCVSSYSVVFVTADESTDMQKLYDLLGSELPDMEKFKGENKYAFAYNQDFDYESLYTLEGIEKVELAALVVSNWFENRVRFSNEDTWFTENEVDCKNLINVTVRTEPGFELTEEMLSATGYNVVHVYKTEETEDSAIWAVYYEKTGEIASPVDFCNKAEEFEGVIGAEFPVAMHMTSWEYYISTEITNLVGDVNGDGIVNISDLILMKRYMLEYVTSDSLDISKSDLNKDGDLSASDFTSIKKRMLK